MKMMAYARNVLMRLTSSHSLIANVAASLLLTACGQSGALQLPNDPNYDKRAKYLLHSDAEKPQKAEENSGQAPAQPPAAAE